jgi:hypothetical protein
MQNRDVWKMLHLLYRHGREGVPVQILESAGFSCGPDAVRTLADGEAVTVHRGGPGDDRLVLSNAANHILSQCVVAHRGPTGSLVEVDRPSAFVIMPFGEKWSTRVFRELIRKALDSQDIRCVRGDMALRVRDLTSNVWSEILSAGFVVVDLSARNPNVYYELGLAHALGKDAFVLKRKGVKLPADFGGAHYIEYDLAKLSVARASLSGQVADWARTVETRKVEKLYAPPSKASVRGRRGGTRSGKQPRRRRESDPDVISPGT